MVRNQSYGINYTSECSYIKTKDIHYYIVINVSQMTNLMRLSHRRFSLRLKLSCFHLKQRSGVEKEEYYGWSGPMPMKPPFNG